MKELYDAIIKVKGQVVEQTKINIFTDALERIDRWESNEYASEYRARIDENPSGSE